MCQFINDWVQSWYGEYDYINRFDIIQFNRTFHRTYAGNLCLFVTSSSSTFRKIIHLTLQIISHLRDCTLCNSTDLYYILSFYKTPSIACNTPFVAGTLCVTTFASFTRTRPETIMHHLNYLKNYHLVSFIFTI